MVVSSSRMIHVEPPPGIWLGDFLGAMRIWLDGNGVRLVLFDRGDRNGARGTFDLSFYSEDEADLFARQFC